MSQSSVLNQLIISTLYFMWWLPHNSEWLYLSPTLPFWDPFLWHGFNFLTEPPKICIKTICKDMQVTFSIKNFPNNKDVFQSRNISLRLSKNTEQTGNVKMLLLTNVFLFDSGRIQMFISPVLESFPVSPEVPFLSMALHPNGPLHLRAENNSNQNTFIIVAYTCVCTYMCY